MEEMEFDDAQAHALLSCLDLTGLAPEDRVGIGLRLAAKLEAILRRLGVDLMNAPDTWEADPLILGPRHRVAGDPGAGPRRGVAVRPRDRRARARAVRAALARGEGGAAAPLRFHSAQQAMRTLLHAANAGDLALAARCLDLDGIPPGARGELGPVLAYKLKFVLDRIGRVAVEEIPTRPTAPGSPTIAASWGASTWCGATRSPAAATGSSRGRPSRGIETMFHATVDRPVAPAWPGEGLPRRPLAAPDPLAVAAAAGCPAG
jgi:MscS family membrane protein